MDVFLKAFCLDIIWQPKLDLKKYFLKKIYLLFLQTAMRFFWVKTYILWFFLDMAMILTFERLKVEGAMPQR